MGHSVSSALGRRVSSYLLNMISWCAHEILALESVHSIQHIARSSVDSLVGFLRRLKRTKGRGRENSPFFRLTAELRPPPDSYHPSGSPGSQTSRLGLNYTTGFPGPPA